MIPERSHPAMYRILPKCHSTLQKLDLHAYGELRESAATQDITKDGEGTPRFTAN